MSKSRMAWEWVLLFLLLVCDVSANGVRRFAAGPKAPHLKRRGLSFEARYGKHTILFYDETSLESAARVHLIPRYPTLVLDDISEHIKEVVCSRLRMTVYFHAPEAMDMAAKLWKRESDIVLISTHSTCASAGSHQPHLVKYVSSDSAVHSITFEAKEQTFKEATHRISVDLGSHVLSDLGLRVKRQEASPTTAVASTTIYNSQGASLPATVSFDFKPPVGSAVGTKGTNDVSFSAKNKAVLPPDPAIVALFPGTKSLDHISLGCKDCSLSGSITLEAAGFDVNSTQLESIIDFFDSGFLQFTTNKLAAHMAFDVGVLPGFMPLSFVANLTRIPLLPIEIPKVMKLGPAIELSIPMSIVLNSPVNFSTGFEVAVPDNSKIILNVSEITGSSQSGFDKTIFKHLPFSANADNLNFNLTTSLRPKLVVSAGVGNTNLALDVEGGFGAFIDFPELTARITAVNNVNATCDGPASKGFQNHAVRVDPYATFNLGLHWGLGYEIGAFQQFRGGEQILATKSFSLPTQCLIFNNKTQSLIPADSSSSTISSPGSNTSSNGGLSVGVDFVTGFTTILLLTLVVFLSL